MQAPRMFVLRRKDRRVIGQGVQWDDGRSTLRMVDPEISEFVDDEVINTGEPETLSALYRDTDVYFDYVSLGE